MRLARLLLLLTVMVSVLAVPEAFGARSKRSTLRHPHARPKSLAKVCQLLEISCSDGTTDLCCGSEKGCLAYCDALCGEPCY